jgi:cytochrome c oxidase assembly protein subunit 11
MATAAALAKASRGKMRTGLAALAFAAGMLMLGYASVPLYRMFCQATGYGGTPRRASEAEAGATQKLAGKTISIRFDANIDPGMKWTFRPEKTTQTVTIGQRSMAFFEAENLTDQTITGRPATTSRQMKRPAISTRCSASASPARHCARMRRCACR